MPLSLQEKLQRPFDNYALEQLRSRFIYTLTENHSVSDGGAIILQMCFETEIGVALKKLVYAPDVTIPLSAFYPVDGRRSFIDIDTDMSMQRYLVQPAIAATEGVKDIPIPYVDFLSKYVEAKYPRYRVCAIASLICLNKVIA